MAQIKEYTQQLDTPVGRAAARIPRADAPAIVTRAGAFAAGVEGFSRGALNLAFAMKERDEEEARAWSASALSQARLDWTTQLIERQSKAEPGAPEFTPKIIGDFDKYADEVVARAPTPTSQRYARERLAEMRATLGGQAMQFEAQARIDWRSDQFDMAIGNTQRLMNTDPNQYQVALAEILATIDSSAMPPIQKSAKRQQAIDKISTAATWAQIQKSPSAFLQSIGFESGDGKTRKTSGDLMGITGNAAFDMLPFEKRSQLFSQAIQLKAQIDRDVETAAKAKREQLADDAMKEAWGMQADGKLRRGYIEQIRPLLKPSEYHALLTALKAQSGGVGQKTDPNIFRDIVRLRTEGKFEEAQALAFSAHKNGRLSNEHLAGEVDRARSQARQTGPNSEYERSRSYIVGALDPGPMVRDPAGKARYTEAVDMFDRWVNSGKRTDQEISVRAKEIVGQFRFLDMTETVMSLPTPRAGKVRRSTSDIQGLVGDLQTAANAAKQRLATGQWTEEEYKQDMEIIGRWRTAVQRMQQGQ